jgi:hypothetical protein
MVNEHNAFDLAKYIDRSNLADHHREQRLSKVDASGRPWPKDVRVQLNSGVFIRCDIRYDGINDDGQRRFLVIAEVDWENYHPTILWVSEYPRDATLIFRIPGLPDAQADRMAAFIELRPMKIIEVD